MLKHNQFKRGDILKADDLNKIVNAVLQALKITAAAPLEISQFGKTTHLRMSQEETFLQGRFASGCTAASGSGPITLGSGILTIWKVYDDSGTWKMNSTSRTLTVYNPAAVAIDQDKMVLCRLQPAGIYFVDWEEC